MSSLTEAIEQQLVERAGLYLVVSEDEEVGLVVSGMVGTDELRAAALDIARELAGGVAVIDDLTVTDAIPDEISEVTPSAGGERGIARVQRPPADVPIEPGDFVSQRLVASAEEASGPERSLETDEVSQGDEVFIPPIDPPTEGEEILAGFGLSSMDEVAVDSSADATFGDEAIRDAVARELREDAATTGLAIEVEVIDGLVRLTGRVASLEDAEAAEEVAGRVPGVVEVDEELEVVSLGR